MTTIQIRRGTAAVASSNNPTLAAGEIGLETDTGKYKIGDGATAWNSLEYAPGAFSVGDLGDVDTSTAAPSSGDALVFDGTNWVPDSGTYAPAASAAVSGRWVAPRIPSGAITSKTLTNERLFAVPVYVDAGTLDDIGVNLTTAGNAGSVLRLGLYDVTADLLPGALVFDAGTVAATSTGFRRITISQAVTVGWKYLAVAAQGATTTEPVAAGVASGMAPAATSNVSIALAGGNSGFSIDSIAGALPDPFGVPSDQSAVPMVGTRYA